MNEDLITWILIVLVLLFCPLWVLGIVLLWLLLKHTGHL